MQNNPAFYKVYVKPAGMWTVLMICIIQVLFSYSSFSQDSSAYATAKARLVKTLKKRFIDEAYTQSIDRFYFNTCDSLIKEEVVIDDCPITDILFRLFTACEDKLKMKSITSLRIPAVNNYFLLTIQDYNKQPLNKLYRQIGIVQTAILQSAFDGLLLGDSIRTFVDLREMLNYPFYIPNRIHLPKYSPYKDTLLYYLANNDPERLVEELSDNNSFITELVKNSHNMTVKAVSRLVADDYFNAVLPFSLAIFENRVSIDEIRELYRRPMDYYHAFVEEVIRLHKNPEPQISAYLKQPIATFNKNMSNSYFINEINSLHESPDRTRFQVISSLTAKELYFIMVAGSDQLYTSSFLYVYKKFLGKTEKEGLDKFFDDIGYYQFDQFLSNICVYGQVNDLVSRLRGKKFAGLLGKYLAKLQSRQLTDHDIILNAMTMSEVIYVTRQYPDVKSILIAEIKNFEKPGGGYDILLQRMYAGLLDILIAKDKHNLDNTYDVLTIDRLKRNGVIAQAWFFYDDEDASGSFASSMAQFSKQTWNKTDRGNYIVFHSKTGTKMNVYMNKPNTEMGYRSAQEEMLLAIKQEGYEVTSYIHRGHSYHVYKSFSLMTASAQFVFLGSCGGTNDVLKVFQLNPDVNVIVTRHIGSKLINDQLLAGINRELVNNRDIKWDRLWKEFDQRFQSKMTKDLFSFYIPPNKYVGVKFIRKVFNY